MIVGREAEFARVNLCGFPQLKVDRRAPSVVGIETLAYYTVELACPEGGWGQISQLSARAREASAQMQGEGVPVRFLRSIFVPEDDTCFNLYEAISEPREER